METKHESIKHKQTGLCTVPILSKIIPGINISKFLSQNINEPWSVKTQLGKL